MKSTMTSLDFENIEIWDSEETSAWKTQTKINLFSSTRRLFSAIFVR